MVFSGIPFLYFYLPLLLLLYFLSPRRLKNAVLLLFSLLFYRIGEPRHLFLMLFSILSAYLFALWMEKRSGGPSEESGAAVAGNRRRVAGQRLLLFFSVLFSLLPLLYYKYFGFAVENLNALFGASFAIPKIALPIGISFYTFQLISYTCDVYRRRVPAQRNFFSLALYVSFFPQLIAGPIVRYADVNEAIAHRTHSVEQFSEGVLRFTVGLGKKVLLANTLGELCAAYRSAGEQTMLFTWIYGAAVCCQIYFDFSGYSDMAIGLGRMFGFSFPENFNYPFLSKGPAEFWRRWHITLGSFFRDYVYIPMGGNRVRFVRWIGNILTVWLLTGLWHGAGWTFLAWGLYFAILLVAEKLLRPWIERIPAGMRHLFTLFLVMVSFLLFDAETLGGAAATVGRLFAFGSFSSDETLYYLRSYGVELLLFGFLGCTDYPKRAARALSKRFPAVFAVLKPMFAAVLLLVSTAYLVDGSFNPFLYFRF